MKRAAPGSFGVQLKALREAAGFTQDELATIAGLSVQAVSALERGERRRPHPETVRALSAALDLTGAVRDTFLVSARAPAHTSAVDELRDVALPLPPTSLVGRDAELATLLGWLAEPAARLISVIGPGGVGKTRLALELARTIAEDGSTGVVFVPLAAVRDAAFVAPAIAEALGMSDLTALDLPKRVRLACADQPTLLVLDNFEQILDAAPLVADLLGSVASLRLLVTSRAALRVRGEREFVVGPLALEQSAELPSPADLAGSSAIRLFVERVRDVQPEFRLTPASGATVAAICRRLDALPLALELAAPWIKVLTADGLLHQLEHDVLLSGAGPRDLPQRQQTMNATVAWSYHLLGPIEQRAFRRLGALSGRFAIEAAAAVLGGNAPDDAASIDAQSAVGALIDKSLLLRTEIAEPARSLFHMLETVRAYAALELTASGERDEAMEGLARYCTTEAALARDGVVGASQVDWLHRVRHNLENYRAAMAWLIERGRSAEASDITWGLRYFWLIRGHTAEGLDWSQRILGAASIPAPAESRALLGAAVMWFARGDFDHARAALARVSALAGPSADLEMIAEVEYLAGHVERAAGHVESARDSFRHSVEVFRALGMPVGVGKSLIGLAMTSLAAADPAPAERLLDEAADVLQHSGPWFPSLALWIRALLAVRRGDARQTIVRVHQTLAVTRDLHDKFAFVFALVPLAAAAALEGRDEWAARILGVRDAVVERTSTTIVDDSVRELTARTERDVRARLGPERWADAYAAGRTSSIDDLIDEIERVLAAR